jgi:hypothetical protein
MSVKAYLSKKGFIRVFEIVIFSFMLFAILLPKFFTYDDPNEWGAVKVQLIAKDLLFSLESTHLLEDALITDPLSDGSDLFMEREKDIELLKNLTRPLLSATQDFEYEIKNIGAPIISVGCICSSEQEEWLKRNALTPSYPTLEFAVKRIELENLSGIFDTFIIFGNYDLDMRRPAIEERLKEGKGFILIANFSGEPDNLTKELFDISISGAGSGERDLGFNNLSNNINAGLAKRFSSSLIRVRALGPGNTGELRIYDGTYRIAHDPINNCFNITSCSDCLREGESCSLPSGAEIKLFQIDPLEGKWMDLYLSSSGANPRDYNFIDEVPLNAIVTGSTVLSDSSKNYALANAGLPNYGLSYDTMPRAFWIYDYDRSRDDLNLLLKAAIIWTSGERYFMFRKTIPEQRVVATHFYTGLRGNDIPFTIKLYIWGY